MTAKTLEQRVEEVEEAMMEQSIVTSYLFDRLGFDLDDLLKQLFTSPKNLEIIRQGLKDPEDIVTLARCVDRWTNHGGTKRIITGVH